MKLEEAIKRVTDTPIQVVCGDDRKYGEARRLLIEAGKRLQEARKKVYFTSRSLLPGETKE